MRNKFKKWDRFIEILDDKYIPEWAYMSYKYEVIRNDKIKKIAKDREKRYRQKCAMDGLYIPPGRPVRIPDDFK